MDRRRCLPALRRASTKRIHTRTAPTPAAAAPTLQVLFLADDYFPALTGKEGGADRPLTELPHCEGDYWPGVAEINAKLLLQGTMTPAAVAVNAPPGLPWKDGHPQLLMPVAAEPRTPELEASLRPVLNVTRAATPGMAAAAVDGDDDDDDAAGVGGASQPPSLPATAAASAPLLQGLGGASALPGQPGAAANAADAAAWGSAAAAPAPAAGGKKKGSGGGSKNRKRDGGGSTRSGGGPGGIAHAARQGGIVLGPDGVPLAYDPLRDKVGELLRSMHRDFIVVKLRASCSWCKRYITGAPGLDVKYHCTQCAASDAPPLSASAQAAAAAAASAAAAIARATTSSRGPGVTAAAAAAAAAAPAPAATSPASAAASAAEAASCGRIAFDLCAACFARESAGGPGAGLISHAHPLSAFTPIPVALAPGLVRRGAADAAARARTSVPAASLQAMRAAAAAQAGALKPEQKALGDATAAPQAAPAADSAAGAAVGITPAVSVATQIAPEAGATDTPPLPPPPAAAVAIVAAASSSPAEPAPPIPQISMTSPVPGGATMTSSAAGTNSSSSAQRAADGGPARQLPTTAQDGTAIQRFSHGGSAAAASTSVSAAYARSSSASASPDGDLVDPDPLLESPIFGTRQAFLNLCQGNHYQFDQLRRAKHSSMMILWHLHHPVAPAFVHSCNACADSIEEGYRWSCSVCEEYDLCEKCHGSSADVHEHKLDRFPAAGLGLEPGETEAEALAKRKAAANDAMLTQKLLVHTPGCVIATGGAGCGSSNCKKLATLLAHAAACTIGPTCAMCRKHNSLLAMHAKRCKAIGDTCVVRGCADYKDAVRRSAGGSQQAMDARRRAVTTAKAKAGGENAVKMGPDGKPLEPDDDAGTAATAASGIAAAPDGLLVAPPPQPTTTTVPPLQLQHQRPYAMKGLRPADMASAAVGGGGGTSSPVAVTPGGHVGAPLASPLRPPQSQPRPMTEAEAGAVIARVKADASRLMAEFPMHAHAFAKFQDIVTVKAHGRLAAAAESARVGGADGAAVPPRDAGAASPPVNAAAAYAAMTPQQRAQVMETAFNQFSSRLQAAERERAKNATIMREVAGHAAAAGAQGSGGGDGVAPIAGALGISLGAQPGGPTAGPPAVDAGIAAVAASSGEGKAADPTRDQR